ncbi:MAG: DPP IV N-terminal domain-containing protein, partial [Acidobacteria bacterium]|nr:DPP IV N-terminal domain-containing protein [Acidobacteriota bacterium]
MSFRTRFVAGSAAALLAASIIPSLQAALALPQQLKHRSVAPPGREEMYRRARTFAAMTRGGVVRARWMADGSFWYADGAPDNTVIYKVDPAAKAKTPLFDTPRLRAALASVLGHEPPYRGLPFETFGFLDRERTIRFSLAGQDYVMPLATYSISKLTMPSRQELERGEPRLVRDDGVNPQVRESLSPDGRWLLGEKGYNLYARSTYDGREVPLTTDGVEHFEWRIGALDNSRAALAKWAPDSFRVGVMKRDDREVWKQPIVHHLKQNDEVEFAPLAKAGARMGLTQIYVVDLLARTQVKAQLPDENDRYLAMFGWLADGSELLFHRMSRDHKKMQLMGMNPDSGAVRTILEETQKTFVRGLGTVPRWDSGLVTLIDGGKRLLYLSERDGWDHLYLYNINGTLVRRLTTGQFPVLRVVDVDAKGGWIYFTAHGEASRPYDTH